MSTIRVGNAPVSWGVYTPTNSKIPYAQILDAIAEAGYEGTELGPYGYYPSDPASLAAELGRRKLELGSSYVSMRLFDAGARKECVDAAIAVGRLLATRGVDEVICADDGTPERKAIAGRVPADGSKGLTAEGWKAALGTLAEVAKALRNELGMSVVVHHHAGTYFETRAEIDRLLAESDPALVNLLLDTGHAVYGGADPLDVVKTHGKRVTYVHYKDVDPKVLTRVRDTDIHMDDAWKAGVFCELGKGMVDFPAITTELKKLGYAGWVIVEQDVVPDDQGNLSPDPFHSAKASRAYLQGLGL
ncbi:MAG: TIM barrel protein [Myxococcales bacterium]|nr:TIM barrel protein [Myxococcales bacterium]